MKPTRRIAILIFASLSIAPLPADELPVTDPGGFTVVLLPDTQYYTHVEGGMEVFRRQTEWIAAQREAREIAMVIHLGDITDHNTAPQWRLAKEAISVLDGEVPYALAVGNHDYGEGGRADKRRTLFNEFFRAADNPLNDPARGGTIGGFFREGEMENVFHTFRAGGIDHLVLVLEWGPRDPVVEWAAGVLAEHPGHRAILCTHAYLYSDGTRYDWEGRGRQQSWNPHSYGTARDEEGTNDGEQLWRKLVRPAANVALTVNGHVLNGGLGLLESENAAGLPVHQMLFNTQFEGRGGDGWLRLLEFQPDGVSLRVRTYSPFLDQWREDERNDFTLNLAPPPGK